MNTPLKYLSQELLEALSKMAGCSSAYNWQNPYNHLFRETFDQLQQKFAAGELAKAVPFVMETAPTGMSLGQLTASLKRVLNYVECNPAYAYGFWGEDEGMLGATPEFFSASLSRIPSRHWHVPAPRAYRTAALP